MPSVEFSDSYRIAIFGYPNNYIRVDYTEVEYDIANNRTKVRLDGVYIKYSGANANCRCYGTLKFNGTTVLTMSGSPYILTVDSSYSYIPNTDNGSTVWVQHNSDGTGSFPITLAGGTRNDDNDDVFGALYYYGSGYPVIGVRTTATKTATLTTRPRGSTISSCPSSIATGNTLNLTVSRASSSFTHIATFKVGSTTLYTSGSFGTSLSFSVPRSWFSAYPTATSLAVSLSVQTYSGSTAIGSPATKSITVNADSGMKPSVSAGWVSLAPYNTGVISNITGYVKGYSKAKATFDSSKVGTANIGTATIASYSIVCQGTTVTGNPALSPLLNTTSVSVVCTVTDTRGRSASETVQLTVMDYAKPAISSVDIIRCDSNGDPDEDGTNYSVTATATYSSLNGQNTCTLTAAHMTAGGTYGTETTITSGTASPLVGPISADLSYTIRVTAVDDLSNTAYYYFSIPTRKWAMKFRPDGNGVAFGKAAEYDGLFEIDESLAVKSKGIVDLIYPVGSLYLSVSSTSPATLFGGIWTRIKDRFLLAAGDVYSAGATGGEAAHTLTTDEMPSHRHYVGAVGWPVDATGPEHINSNWGSSAWPKVTPIDSTDDAGGGAAHNNMPPYLAVYVWKRTA